MAYSPDFKGIQLSVADDELSCPVCCAVFQEPKLLPNCAHSFCKDCLRELSLHSFHSSQVSCPVCRKISNLPQNGVEGLATNTLLVRLIDNIPGRKEKEAIVKALKRCKEEIQKCKNVQDDLEKNLSQIREYKEQGLKLKKEVTEHAQKAVDSIRKWEQDCHKEIDSHLSHNCGLDLFKLLVEQKNKRRNHMDEAATCMQMAEEILKRDKMSEILEMKDVIEDQLNEYSSVPQCRLLQKGNNVHDFSMMLQKHDSELNIGELLDNCVNLPSGLSELTSSTRPPNLNCTQASINAPTLERNHIAHLTEFEPFNIALCPQSGDIALLWKERWQVYLYNKDIEYMRRILIKHGDLWDVGFTIDDEVVVVDRANNRLLLYEKKGRFVEFEVEMPRQNLKFTHVSVDVDGRFIVTSTKIDDDDDDDDNDDETVVPCIIVYENNSELPQRMFGRRQLNKPISRAVFLNGKYYVADECNKSTTLEVFTSQGQHISSFDILNWFCSISIIQPSLVALHTIYGEESDRKLVFITNGGVVCNKMQRCLLPGLKQAVVLSGSPCTPVKQLEIYRGVKCFCKVEYPK